MIFLFLKKQSQFIDSRAIFFLYNVIETHSQREVTIKDMFHVFSFIEQRVRCQKRNDQRVRNKLLTDRGERNQKLTDQPVGSTKPNLLIYL